MQKGVVRKRPTKGTSEYGRQLQEKQELKRQYHLRERQFSKYVRSILEEAASHGNSPELLMQSLEKRLDNVIFRMGLAITRPQARQLVSHGHFLVNGRPLNIPSYQVKKGDVISIHPTSKNNAYIKGMLPTLKKYEAPAWMNLDKDKLEAAIVGEPTLEEISPTVELALIFEFYSR